MLVFAGALSRWATGLTTRATISNGQGNLGCIGRYLIVADRTLLSESEKMGGSLLTTPLVGRNFLPFAP
ncbi:MAG: hypothetical protein J07HN4v3_00281 [Halonotius sp. J07HN4]|nr:MAG: hypothetical protein J07HN4v3_00281 [Halonotius sp. J07HN4]